MLRLLQITNKMFSNVNNVFQPKNNHFLFLIYTVADKHGISHKMHEMVILKTLIKLATSALTAYTCNAYWMCKQKTKKYVKNVVFSVQIAMFKVSEILLQVSKSQGKVRNFFHSDVWQPWISTLNSGFLKLSLVFK